jgi:hypothetical protein
MIELPTEEKEVQKIQVKKTRARGEERGERKQKGYVTRIFEPITPVDNPCADQGVGKGF